ncbi:MAG: Holliday junction resolvase RuvX [Rickettsiales bacterium]|nr:Holliday junction resolvase RuvX [Rickettsiales bacterium]
MLKNSLQEFCTDLAPKGRLLGLDHGSKTIGIALSDAERQIATPLETIKKTKFSQDIERLNSLIAEHSIAGLIVGYPLNMDGSEGPRCQSVRAFVRNLEEHTPLPILLSDERLSSFAADEAMLEADLSREKRAQHIDKVAASVILQGVLDRMRESS